MIQILASVQRIGMQGLEVVDRGEHGYSGTSTLQVGDDLLCLGVYVCMFTMPCMWRSEDSSEELLLSLYLV